MFRAASVSRQTFLLHNRSFFQITTSKSNTLLKIEYNQSRNFCKIDESDDDQPIQERFSYSTKFTRRKQDATYVEETIIDGEQVNNDVFKVEEAKASKNTKKTSKLNLEEKIPKHFTSKEQRQAFLNNLKNNINSFETLNQNKTSKEILRSVEKNKKKMQEEISQKLKNIEKVAEDEISDKLLAVKETLRDVGEDKVNEQKKTTKQFTFSRTELDGYKTPIQKLNDNSTVTAIYSELDGEDFLKIIPHPRSVGDSTNSEEEILLKNFKQRKNPEDTEDEKQDLEILLDFEREKYKNYLYRNVKSPLLTPFVPKSYDDGISSGNDEYSSSESEVLADTRNTSRKQDFEVREALEYEYDLRESLEDPELLENQKILEAKYNNEWKKAREAKALEEKWMKNKLKKRFETLTKSGRKADANAHLKSEPGYAPDYIPKLANMDDDSDWGYSGTEHSDIEDKAQSPLGNYKNSAIISNAKASKLRRKSPPLFIDPDLVPDSGSDYASDSPSEVYGNFAEELRGQKDISDDDRDVFSENSEGAVEHEDDEAELVEDQNVGASEGGELEFESTSESGNDDANDSDVDDQFTDDRLHAASIFTHQILIKTGQHTKVTFGGRINTLSVLLLAGNGEGVVGLGYGKGESYAIALKNAIRDATKKAIVIHRVDGTLSYQTKQKYCRSRVYVWPLAKNAGLRCSYKFQEICELIGITDVRIKTFGRRNDHNVFVFLFLFLFLYNPNLSIFL